MWLRVHCSSTRFRCWADILRAVVREFVEHYHAERNHQGLGNVIPFPIPFPSPDSASSVGRVARRERLGGVLSFYGRKAA